MRRNIELSRTICRMLFDMLFVVLLAIFVEEVLMKGIPNPILWIVIVTFYVISYCVRNWGRRYITAILLHIPLVVTVLFMPFELVPKIMLVMVVIHLVSESMEHIKRGGRVRKIDDIPWPSFLVIFIAYLFAVYTNSGFTKEAAYIIPVIMLVVYYIMVYLDGLNAYMESTKDVHGIPLSKVISRNNLIVGVITVLLFICMVIGRFLDYSELVKGLKTIAIATAKLIYSVFVILKLLFSKFVSTTSGGSSSFAAEEVEYMSKQVENIGDSFIVILYVFLGALALYLLVRVAKYLLKILFAARKFENDIVEVAENKKENFVADNKKSLFGGRLTIAEKIRKQYKKGIERYKYSVKLRSDKTSRELAREIKSEGIGDVDELTDLYAQVRYGNIEADRNLLRRVSQLSVK